MEPKKISFGFMKTKKTEKPVEDEKKDYIECVEEKAIKVVGGEAVQEEKPLVIPMKPNTLITAERLREIAEKVENNIAEDPQSQIKTEPLEEKPVENETLDQMAVRELLQDAKKEVKVETTVMTVPVPAKPVIDGEKESTLEDYDSVPIQDFGMAMLRGMGWTPNKDGSKYKPPELRPKGLGLGADKVIKENQKKNASKSSQNKDEELAIVKNSFVKIITGKYSGCYGKVVSLDEDNGRVMVEIPIKKETVSLSEFMMQPVTKSEFDKESRVINQDTYEEYKKKEGSQKSRHESPNEPSSSYKSNEIKEYKRERKDGSYKESGRKEKRVENNRDDRTSNGRNRERKKRVSSSSEEGVRRSRRDASSEDRSSKKKKDGKKYSSCESLDSLPDEKKKKHKSKKRDSLSSEEKVRRNRRDSSSEDRSSKKKKEKKKYSSSESLDSLPDEKKKKHKSRRNSISDEDSDDNKKSRRRSKTPDGKRDIDKKRKGKKKRRDRDRSPNHKKHRK